VRHRGNVWDALTSISSVRGGPSAISSDFVPGRILRDASAAPPGNLGEYNDRPGEVGPLWSSAIGGGEGSRGDDEGEIGVVMMQGARCEVARERILCAEPEREICWYWRREV
jgi:hypothetical protein